MLKEGQLYFNEFTNFDYNLYLEEYPSIPSCNEEYEEIRVEGRNGSLYINKGTYEDKKINFTFTILSQEIDIDFEKVYKWLDNITDSRLIFGRLDKCFRVKKIIYGNIQKEFRTIGEFDITFICQPFTEDLESTTYELIERDFEFYYNGDALSYPLIRIEGQGTFNLTVNENLMVIKNVSFSTEIDSELKQVRDENGLSKDREVNGNFPVLISGINKISYKGGTGKAFLTFTTKYKY